MLNKHNTVAVGSHGKCITVDVYTIPCEVTTQLQLAFVGVMVSFLERVSEAYGFIISNCSDTLYCCPAVTQR
jgi:hypothetical protein